MRAVTCHDTRLEVVDLPDPVPAKGQLVLDVLRTGICGSDLHARTHADELHAITAELGYDHVFRQQDTVVLGHEVCGSVAEVGKGTKTGLKAGQTVVTFPLVRGTDKAVNMTGLSPLAPGGYAERMLAQAAMTLPVPNGLAPEIAALTEPMAVALHAVRRGQVGKNQVAVVVGCGPVGLGVIAMLKATGVKQVVASDPSAGRRTLASAVGADVVVDPTTDPLFTDAAKHKWVVDAPTLLDLAVGAMEKLTQLPRWWDVYRTVDRLGLTALKAPIVFECVGIPGMLDRIVADAPLSTRVVVVGVCMEPDRIRPAMAINKEVDLRFVLGYTPLELRDALHLMADGKATVAPIVTGMVGLDGVATAFDVLAGAQHHAKVLIDPQSTATTP